MGLLGLAAMPSHLPPVADATKPGPLPSAGSVRPGFPGTMGPSDSLPRAEGFRRSARSTGISSRVRSLLRDAPAGLSRRDFHPLVRHSTASLSPEPRAAFRTHHGAIIGLPGVAEAPGSRPPAHPPA